MPDYTPTTIPDRVIDQSFGIETINTLLDNDTALWSALDVEHDKRTGEHSGLAFPVALALVRFEPARRSLSVAGTASVAAAGTTVTGAGSDFTTLRACDIFRFTTNAEERSIARVVSATSLEVNPAFTTAAAAPSAYTAYRTAGESGYYLDEMSYGFLPQIERMGPGVVRLCLATAAAKDTVGPYPYRKRIAIVGHHRADWNSDEGPSFTAEWKKAGADAGDSATVNQTNSVGSYIEVVLHTQTAPNYEDHPFFIAVFIEGA